MAISARAQAVLDFWRELGPAGWYVGSDDLDADIRARFETDWNAARAGGLGSWLSCPEGMLAYLLLTDQFPRNMFRGQGQAFATDARARHVAAMAWQNGRDLKIDGAIRQFFYLPLMHSENPFDQDRCVALFLARMPDRGGQNTLHARAHREIIRRYRRFPFRNAALGRQTTPAEAAFITAGGYGAIVQSLSA